jgi:hypothetical protein
MMLGNGPPPTRTIGVENVAVSLAAQIVPPCFVRKAHSYSALPLLFVMRPWLRERRDCAMSGFPLRNTPMKNIAILTLFLLGTALSYPAAACDWNRQANATPIVVTDCSNGNCTNEQSATDEAASTQSATQQPAACTGAGCEQADAATVQVAAGSK